MTEAEESILKKNLRDLTKKELSKLHSNIKQLEEALPRLKLLLKEIEQETRKPK